MPSASNPPAIYIGSYLYPPTFLARPNYDDKAASADVIDHVTLAGSEILVTRMGGLFTAIPVDLIGERKTPEGHLLWDHMQAQLDFEQHVCDTFNLLICEFCLNGHVAEPASPAFLGTGLLRGNRLHVEKFHGAPVSYSDRVVTAAAATRHDELFTIIALDADTKLLPLSREATTSNRLASIAPTLPAFVAAAYSLYSQHRLPEALIDAWIASEQIIDNLWDAYTTAIPDKARHDRLADSRTYTAAVRLEVLFTAGRLPQELYAGLQIARQHRNNVSHRAKVDFFATMHTLDALKSLIQFVTDRTVSDFPPPGGPLWDLKAPDEPT